MLLPDKVPVMTLSNVILFPQAMLPLHIFEPRYRRMLADCLLGARVFVVALQRLHCRRESPSQIAGLGLVRASVCNADGTSNLILQGLARVRLGPARRYRPYRVHEVHALTTSSGSGLAHQGMTSRVLELVDERLDMGMELPFKALNDLAPGSATEEASGETLARHAFRQVMHQLADREDAEQLVDLISATLLSSPAERQTILETPDLDGRLRFLVSFLTRDLVRRKRPGE